MNYSLSKYRMLRGGESMYYGASVTIIFNSKSTLDREKINKLADRIIIRDDVQAKRQRY